MKKRIILTIVTLSIITFSYYFSYKSTLQNPLEEISGIQQKQMGILSTNEKRQLVFTNVEYKFTLTFPAGWMVWNEAYKSGYVQVFNYPQELASPKGGFVGKSGLNKIETYILNSNVYTRSLEYPEKEISSENIVFGLNTFTKTRVELQDGEKFVSYYIQVPETNKFLNVVIYGDEKNFSVLETVLKGLVFGEVTQ